MFMDNFFTLTKVKKLALNNILLNLLKKLILQTSTTIEKKFQTHVAINGAEATKFWHS